MEDFIQKTWPFLAFLIVQTVAGVWWAASMTTKQKNLDDDMKGLASDMKGFAGTGERFAKIETLLTELIKKFDAFNKRGRS